MNDEQNTASRAPQNNKWTIGLVVIVLLAAAIYFIKNNPQQGADTSETVATVNGVEISRNTLLSSVTQAQTTQGETSDAAGLERQVLDSLVAEELLFQEAKTAGVTANEEQVQQQFDQLVGQFENTEAFQNELDIAQMTEQDVREAMTRSNVIQAYLDGAIPPDSIEVSDEEIQTQLDAFAQQTEGQEGVNLDEIRPLIEQQLQQEKYQQQVAALIENLRAQSDVTILL